MRAERKRVEQERGGKEEAEERRAGAMGVDSCVMGVDRRQNFVQRVL